MCKGKQIKPVAVGCGTTTLSILKTRFPIDLTLPLPDELKIRIFQHRIAFAS
jgi:hypothetical protein